MSKKFVLGAILLALLPSQKLFACDLCSIYIGISPNDFKNSFSVRHRYRLFEKKYEYQSNGLFTNNATQRVKGEPLNKHGGNSYNNEQNMNYTYKEVYNSYDVSASFFLNNKWKLGITIPFSDNFVLKNDSVVSNIAGIGDLVTTINYQLFNSQNFTCDTTQKKSLTHRFTIGSGISFPTGNYNKYSIVDFETDIKPNTIIGTAIKELDPHLQAGYGSFGYIATMEYLAKYGSIGFNGNISYRINTTNSNGFRFANRFNANMAIFVLANIGKKIKVMPNLGLNYEFGNKDIQDNNFFNDSGGETLFFSSGLNLYINKISVDFSYYKPIMETLHGDQLYNNERFITQLSYSF